MGLNDIVQKAKTVYPFALHGTTLKFVEVGYDKEQLVRKLGLERVLKQNPEATAEEKENATSLYVYYQMLHDAGETISIDEFFALPGAYLKELMYAINLEMSHKIHTETKRLEDELRKILKAKATA